MRPRSLVSGVALLASATLWLGWMLACGKKPAPAPTAQPAAQPAAAQPTEVSPVVVDSLASFMHGTMELATLNVIVDQNMAPGDAQIIKQQAAICSAQPPGEARIQCFDNQNQTATNTAQPATTTTTTTPATTPTNGADWGAHAQPKQD